MARLSRRSQRARDLASAFALTWKAGPALLAGQVVVAVLAGLAPVLAAWLLRAILDDLAAGASHRLGAMLLLGAAVGVAGGATALLPNVAQYLSAQGGRVTARRATETLFAAVTALAGLRRLEDPAFRDRLRVAQQAGSSGPGQIVSGGLDALQSALTLAGFLGTLVVVSPVLAAVMIAAAVPAVIVRRAAARRQVAVIMGISHAQRRQFFYANLLVDLAAAKEIRLFGLGGFFRGLMLGELRDIQRASQQADRQVLRANLCLTALGAVITIAGLMWAVDAAATGRLTVGDVSVLVAALLSGESALEMIISQIALTYQALLMFESFRSVLAEQPDLAVAAHPLPVPPMRNGIEVDDVWFRYGPDEPWILRGVTCFIPRGHALAIVGRNGAGKSTLVKLLCRFYDPDRGRILWDGVDLRELDPTAFRDRISVVFQDYMNYELSASANIEVGDLGQAGQRDAIEAAARRAGVHDALVALPRGYQTMLTRAFFEDPGDDNPQAGVLLSGGQWQRVALARSFLRTGRDLIILDEPSSGLDAEAEHEIHASLAQKRHGSSAVLISHRLNTVRDADHIIVLSDGVISEQGSHDALMARSGIYARLFSLQARGYALDMGAPEADAVQASTAGERQ
jgi:ATP-binding cassette, subfamily B, bacterial